MTSRAQVPDTHVQAVLRALASLRPGDAADTMSIVAKSGLSTADVNPALAQLHADGRVEDEWVQDGHLRTRYYRMREKA